MKRRDFLSTTLAVAAAGLSPPFCARLERVVEMLLDEPIGTIAPELQGHFTEHIGEVVYDGIWVGEDSEDCQCRRNSQGAGGPHAAIARAGDSLARRMLCR